MNVIGIVAVLGLVLVVLLAVVYFVVMRGGSSEPEPRVRVGSRGSSARRINWLVGQSGALEGKTYHVGKRTMTIGRKVGNHIQVLDDRVSRVHCQFKPHGATLAVIDRDSDNGTYVNDERIEAGAEHVLRTGDKVRVGSSVLTYYQQADFAVDNALTDSKSASMDQHKPTQAMDAGDMGAMLEDYLYQAGGDVRAAANLMGVEEQVFRNMMKMAGVKGGD